MGFSSYTSCLLFTILFLLEVSPENEPIKGCLWDPQLSPIFYGETREQVLNSPAGSPQGNQTITQFPLKPMDMLGPPKRGALSSLPQPIDGGL